MYRHLFFDADGTLFDFDQAEHHAFWAMAEALGLSLTQEHESLYKMCNLSCWKAFEQGTLTVETLKSRRFELFSQESGILLDASQASRLYQHHLSLQGILYPHSRDLLKTLKNRGYVLYLASNGIAEVQHGRIEAAGIAGYFEHIFISEEIGYQKPDPRFFEAMMSAASLHTQKELCLMIGDSLSSDIAGGVAYGIDTLWLNLGDSNAPASEAATYTLTSLEAIGELLVKAQ